MSSSEAGPQRPGERPPPLRRVEARAGSERHRATRPARARPDPQRRRRARRDPHQLAGRRDAPAPDAGAAGARPSASTRASTAGGLLRFVGVGASAAGVLGRRRVRRLGCVPSAFGASAASVRLGVGVGLGGRAPPAVGAAYPASAGGDRLATLGRLPHELAAARW